MGLFFEIRSGPHKGLRAPVTAGLQIGRAVSFGVRLKDPKASAVHAEVALEDGGHFVLFDKGSTNQIKTADGRVQSLNLFDGLTFKIGSTRFYVVSEEEDVKKSAVEHVQEKRQELPEWRQILVDYFRSSDLRLYDGRPVLRAFAHPLEVTVICGFQTGTSWTLGYGPREFGRVCGELSLWDEACPHIAFKLVPQPDGSPSIEVVAEGKVLVNGKPTRTQPLNENEVISVGEVQMKVRFLAV